MINYYGFLSGARIRLELDYYISKLIDAKEAHKRLDSCVGKDLEGWVEELDKNGAKYGSILRKVYAEAAHG